MKGVCVCCARQSRVGGTPLRCTGCLSCSVTFVDGAWVGRRHGPTHGVPDDDLETYVGEHGFITWRPRIGLPGPVPASSETPTLFDHLEEAARG